MAEVRVVETAAGLQELADGWRRQGARVGLVPTMGALHDGHLSLVRRARADCDRVTVSIFVNPLQFGPSEDFGRYPRQMERDLSLLAAEEVDAAFTPSVDEMYGVGAAAGTSKQTTRVAVRGLEDVLEGASRPGHFEGVATVVTKLFNAARPHVAYFGQKDAQQAALITRMARDLGTGIDVAVVPTVREADGLALSSRNAYLAPEEREAGLCLHRALVAANRAYEAGERDAERLRGEMRSVLDAEPLADVDYAEVVDPETFLAPGSLAVLAVRIGRTRLIDNHRLGTPL